MTRSTIFLLVFFIALALNIAGNAGGWPDLQAFSKPFIVPALIGYFGMMAANASPGFRNWIFAALLLSWIGDVLLLFESRDALFFLLGLSAFLLAHVAYILFFHRVRVKEKVRSRAWLLIIVVAYYAVLISVLSPGLGDMKLPVRVYGLVISFMFLLALHMLFLKPPVPGRWMMAGALLFVISDSVLAINKFYQSFPGAGIVIMLTYGLAQFGIVMGAVQYLRASLKTINQHSNTQAGI